MKKNHTQGVYVAIALALYEISSGFTHDDEAMRLTIRRSAVPSAWGLKSHLLRQKPETHF